MITTISYCYKLEDNELLPLLKALADTYIIGTDFEKSFSVDELKSIYDETIDVDIAIDIINEGEFFPFIIFQYDSGDDFYLKVNDSMCEKSVCHGDDVDDILDELRKDVSKSEIYIELHSFFKENNFQHMNEQIGFRFLYLE